MPLHYSLSIHDVCILHFRTLHVVPVIFHCVGNQSVLNLHKQGYTSTSSDIPAHVLPTTKCLYKHKFGHFQGHRPCGVGLNPWL